MKTHFFKIVLPAFALILTITASLASTSTENNAKDTSVSEGYYFESTLNPCKEVVVQCTTNITEWYCTVEINGEKEQIKAKITIGGSICGLLLYQVAENTNGVAAIPNHNFPNP